MSRFSFSDKKTKQALIVIGLLVLIVELCLLGLGQQRLRQERETHRQLVQQTEKFAVTSHKATGYRPSRRSHSSRSPNAGSIEGVDDLANALVAFAPQIGRNMSGLTLGWQEKQQYLKLIQKFQALEPSQWESLFGKVQSAGLIRQAEDRVIMACLLSVAPKNPEVLLETLVAGPEFITKYSRQQILARAAMANWSREDIQEVLTWVREHEDELSPALGKVMQDSLITSVAERDPVRAFQVVEELGVQLDIKLVNAISLSATTPETRRDALSALKNSLARHADNIDRERMLASGVRAMALGQRSDSDFVKIDFEQSVEVIEAAGLSESGLNYLKGSLFHYIDREDAHQWVEWLGAGGLQGDDAAKRIRGFVSNWSRYDYKVAGRWLEKAPDSAMKQVAAGTYARRVFLRDRQASLRWLESLPPGEERKETARDIYKQWPQNRDEDRAAASDFANREGISD